MSHHNSDAGTNSTVFLRRITIFTFPPAFIMLIIAGVEGNRVFPALGLIPQAASVIFGYLLLYRERVIALGSPIRAFSPSNTFCVDMALAIWYLGFLIPTWIALPWQRDEPLIILATYSSVFMMVNLLVKSDFPCPGIAPMLTTSHI